MRSTWVLAGLLAVITWPRMELTPMEGLDPSWVAALYMAAHQRARPWAATSSTRCGPLGFLRFPVLYYPKLTALALVYTALTQYACCVAILYAARRTFALPVGAACSRFSGPAWWAWTAWWRWPSWWPSSLWTQQPPRLLRRVFPAGRRGALAARRVVRQAQHRGDRGFALFAVAVATLEGSRRRNSPVRVKRGAVPVGALAPGGAVARRLAGLRGQCRPGDGRVFGGDGSRGRDPGLGVLGGGCARRPCCDRRLACRPEWGGRRRWGVLLRHRADGASERSRLPSCATTAGTPRSSSPRWLQAGSPSAGGRRAASFAISGFLVLFVAYLGVARSPSPGR